MILVPVAAVPFFEALQDGGLFVECGPDRFAAFQGDFVPALGGAVGFATEMRSRRDPQDAVHRHMLVINADEDRHDGTLASGNQ